MRNHERTMRNYKMLKKIMKEHLEEAKELMRIIDKHKKDMYGSTVKIVKDVSEEKIKYYEKYVELVEGKLKNG